MSAIAKTLTVVESETKDTMLALKSSVYPGAKDESITMVLAYCRAAGLDPLQKPVHIVPMQVKDSKSGEYEWRDIVMPGIGLYRTNAARTGEYAGVTEPEFGPDVTQKLGDAEITFPSWCRVTVKRLVQGKIVEFTANERWLENYATKKRDTREPNAMWKRRPYAQLAKCAEAQALRKAFPELGGQPTAEELEGKVIEAGDADVLGKTAVEMPRARSAPAEGQAEPPTDTRPTLTGPIDASMAKLLRAQLARAALTDADLCRHFKVKTVEELDRSQINNALDWIKNPGE